MCKLARARPLPRLLSTTSGHQPAGRATKNPVSVNSAKELHARLIRTQLHRDPNSVSTVLKAYALSPPTLHKAHLVFNEIDRPTPLIWNHMIRGLSQSERPSEAFLMYDRMCGNALSGDNLTFIFLFKACARVLDLLLGHKLHARALKLGFGSYLFVSNALVHMYASCGQLGFARQVFDGMGERDLVSWNSLIGGFTGCNRYREVLGLFDAMREAKVKADARTMVKVILACSYLDDQDMADSAVKYIEENRVDVDVYLGNTMIDMYGRRGLVDLAWGVFDKMRERNVVSWNAMIVSYAKAGNLFEAEKLFDEMPERNVISWSTMITGYCQAKEFDKAMKLFREMMIDQVKPDKITITSALSACGHLGLLDVGKKVHKYIHDRGIEADIYVGNSLIDMYCKCGFLEKALDVFQDMKETDSVSWTSIISGLAVNGFANSALKLFSQMLSEGVQPIHGTFIGILSACARAGLVDKGLEYFENMEKDYGLTPEMTHYGCVVDLLGCSGNLDRAYEFINKMPIAPDVVIWRSLLHSCTLHRNVVLAVAAYNKLLELDPSNSGNYVLLSKTFAGPEKGALARRVKKLMDDIDVRKESGCSSIYSTGMTSN